MPRSRFLDGPAGRLDSRWQGPVDGRPVLLLHPHPAFGGSMGSRLVYDLALGLAEAGFRTVRFDFRGVGRSQGRYDRGIGETEDAMAVWDALREQTSQAPAVVGHSFGGGVATRLARQRPVPSLVLVGTPDEVSFSDLHPADDAAHVRADAHLVIGTEDDFLTRAGVERLAAAFPHPAHLHVLEGAGHFLEPEHNPRALQVVRKALGADKV